MNQSMQAMYKVTSLCSTPEIQGVDGLTSDKTTQDPKSEGAVQGKIVSVLDNMAATSVFATSETFAGGSFVAQVSFLPGNCVNDKGVPSAHLKSIADVHCNACLV